ncbi:MAG: adenine phosphoribosyltransferase [Candidatus Gracilibacteria bacterium]
MNLDNYIRNVENFPIEGISFKDITPILSNTEAFNYVIEEFSKNLTGIDKIVALDARGFIFGGALSYKLGIPFIPIRKEGKLPSNCIKIEYELEYGKKCFEIHTDSIIKGDKIAIIDDLLATGGTAKASVDLVEELGGIVHSLNFVADLTFLNGKDKLKGLKINSLIKY